MGCRARFKVLYYLNRYDVSSSALGLRFKVLYYLNRYDVSSSALGLWILEFVMWSFSFVLGFMGVSIPSQLPGLHGWT